MRKLKRCKPLDAALKQPLFFGDSLPFLRKEAWLPKSKALSIVCQAITGSTFNAHDIDALGDSEALRPVLETPRLQVCLKQVKQNSKPIRTVKADMEEKEKNSKWDVFQRHFGFPETIS